MNFCYLKNNFDLFYLLSRLRNTDMGLPNPIKRSGYLKPKSPPVLLRFQHLPPLQFLQQQRFDFFRVCAGCFFVVFEDFESLSVLPFYTLSAARFPFKPSPHAFNASSTGASVLP